MCILTLLAYFVRITDAQDWRAASAETDAEKILSAGFYWDDGVGLGGSVRTEAQNKMLSCLNTLDCYCPPLVEVVGLRCSWLSCHIAHICPPLGTRSTDCLYESKMGKKTALVSLDLHSK